MVPWESPRARSAPSAMCRSGWAAASPSVSSVSRVRGSPRSDGSWPLSRASAGSVLYKGQAFNPGNARQADWKTARREVQVVFQDPAASLNPRLRVGDSLAEGLRVRGEGGYRANRDAVTQMMGLVGVPRDAAHR